jgi:hypothetical protein
MQITKAVLRGVGIKDKNPTPEDFYDDMITKPPFSTGYPAFEKNAANLAKIVEVLELWKSNPTKGLSIHYTSNNAYDSEDNYQTWHSGTNSVIFIVAGDCGGVAVGINYSPVSFPVYIFNGSSWSTYTSSFGHTIIVNNQNNVNNYYTWYDTYANYIDQ